MATGLAGMPEVFPGVGENCYTRSLDSAGVLEMMTALIGMPRSFSRCW